MEVEDALRACEALNRLGISATLDSLGENVSTAEAARRSAGVYHRLLDAIKSRGLDANVSVKLSQMGMELDEKLAYQVVSELVEHAVTAHSFVRVDMEGTEYTQATIDLVRNLHGKPGNGSHTGIVIQAYLFRSEQDVKSLLADGIRIRLCKGAYQEPPDRAFPDKKDVDANFVKLMKMLLASGVYHGIATHDEKMIEATRQFVDEQGIDPASFEFQMLYGVRRDLQKALVADGFRMRVYVPFGTEWYPYFMRRLAERPANALFIAKNMLKR
jgi:proline dehydrogenase